VRKVYLLTAALAGCLRDGARPYEDYLEDLAKLPDAGTPGDGMLDAETGPLCSQSPVPLQPLDVTFSNRTGMDGDLVWIKPDCTPMPIARLDNGADVTAGTYVRHVWRLELRNSDQVIGAEVRLASDTTMVVFE